MTTSAHELRYRGSLLGFHASLDAAKAHAAKHHADLEDKEQLTIEPARAVHLFCRGNLIETFRTKEAAAAYAAKKATPRAPLAAWLAVDMTEGNDLAQALADHARALDPAPVLEHEAAELLEHAPEHAPAPPATATAHHEDTSPETGR